jgi:hypothetical protein
MAPSDVALRATPTLLATDPLDVLLDLIGGNARPGRHIKMQPPGATDKYTYVKQGSAHLPITDAELRAHIDGHATYGGLLTGSDGLARALVIELDQDSMAGARASCVPVEPEGGVAGQRRRPPGAR